MTVNNSPNINKTNNNLKWLDTKWPRHMLSQIVKRTFMTLYIHFRTYRLNRITYTKQTYNTKLNKCLILFITSGRLHTLTKGRHGHDVVGFTTTCVISVYHHESWEFEPRSWRVVLHTTLCGKVCQWLVHDEVYSIQHYVVKFVSDLWQVDGLIRVLRFTPPIKLTATK